MNSAKPSSHTHLQDGIKRIFRRRRVKVVLITVAIVSLPILATWLGSYVVLYGRLLFIGFVLLTVFGIFERWPTRIPSWLARWALQVLAVAIAVPIATFAAYSITTMGDTVPWWRDNARLSGFGMMTFMGILVVPWISVAALFRQIKDEAHKQALTFELERSNFEKQALDARLRLLQAQVQPHFLFNTLANVRELVNTGSPRASSVLDSLIAYLRAAVPRLNEPIATMGQEIDLVRAYLEVMHMRMPDRLQFTLHAEDDAKALSCPPMTLLTLVENAMRHSIDPSEEGGRIDIRVALQDGRCRAEVADTGVGLMHTSAGLGTGLANLRERLQLAFGGDASLQLSAVHPHGTLAAVSFAARTGET